MAVGRILIWQLAEFRYGSWPVKAVGRLRGVFEVQEVAFCVESSAVSGEGTVAADYPVAGNEYGNGIGAVC